ncbi:MAG: hypothetical protein EBS35_02095 [Bacteroidetes bacterium]|nr:hypothetical protein [Bacteroidota bacterium]
MHYSKERAQESRAAVERLYIAMRHLFIRGSYKPLGISGEAMIEALMVLRPEIYGTLFHPERIELDGLLYVFQRLPKGIESCRLIRMVSREGYAEAGFPSLIAPKRKRNAFRIDEEQMFIEMTRGRSDIYDIMTHLTFLFIESEKIRKNSLDIKGEKSKEWLFLEKWVLEKKDENHADLPVAYTHLSTILRRTYQETVSSCHKFELDQNINSLFEIVYWMGALSINESRFNIDREISFSVALREHLGHHLYGESWAHNIKIFLQKNNLFNRPIHLISANMHSVMNSLYAQKALEDTFPDNTSLEEIAKILSMEENGHLRKAVQHYAMENGLYPIEDVSGTNIPVQIIDLQKIKTNKSVRLNKPLLLVMDYAFGEQAYETFDELFRPWEEEATTKNLSFASISVIGKAGILKGDKGDIMIPNAHVFEGTADNYPVDNDLSPADFEGNDLGVYYGPMVTVLGTSLQNKDILSYFLHSSWHAIGLEMEGAHYQKAIQAASKIRNNIPFDIPTRYVYYASDNPLETGSTLASGSLGLEGVKPTYLCTKIVLQKIFDALE